MQEEIQKLTKEKNQAYWERNQLVAALSKIFPAYLAKHDPSDKEWEKDWRTIVYIKIPVENTTFAGMSFEQILKKYSTSAILNPDTGELFLQTSWHIHDMEIPLFDHLQYVAEGCQMWDNHDTEEKYRRLRKIIKK